MVLYVGQGRLYRPRARLELVVGTVGAIGFLLVSLTKSFVVGLFLVLVSRHYNNFDLSPCFRRLSTAGAREMGVSTRLQTANTSLNVFVLLSYLFIYFSASFTHTSLCGVGM